MHTATSQISTVWQMLALVNVLCGKRSGQCYVMINTSNCVMRCVVLNPHIFIYQEGVSIYIWVTVRHNQQSWNCKFEDHTTTGLFQQCMSTKLPSQRAHRHVIMTSKVGRGVTYGSGAVFIQCISTATTIYYKFNLKFGKCFMKPFRFGESFCVQQNTAWDIEKHDRNKITHIHTHTLYSHQHKNTD